MWFMIDVMIYAARTETPTILFGAFDRHNFGDLLLAHVAAALLPGRRLIFGGLAGRDLRGYGGHRVEALADLVAAWGERPIDLLHVGGEILTCDAWSAAVMLATPEEARQAIAHYDGKPAAMRAWAAQRLGLSDLAPYVIAPTRFAGARRIACLAAGGVGLGDQEAVDPALRGEVLAKLAAADAVGVRDRHTLAELTQLPPLPPLQPLAEVEIRATLQPDPVALVAELFGRKIARRAAAGEVAAMRRTFPQAYLAIQCSADFGDDATLAIFAGQLDRVAAATGFGLVFFRAGAAPWHDDLDVYRRLAARLGSASARIFTSLDIWDIGALLAASRGYCGSSLHGRIVAMAYGRPRINVLRRGEAAARNKPGAYAASWEVAGMPQVVAVEDVAEGLLAALAPPPEALAASARQLAAECRRGLTGICRALV